MQKLNTQILKEFKKFKSRILALNNTQKPFRIHNNNKKN